MGLAYLEGMSTQSNRWAALQREFNEVKADPSTPRWALQVITLALQADVVDAANVLAVLARLFDERASLAALGQGQVE